MVTLLFPTYTLKIEVKDGTPLPSPQFVAGINNAALGQNLPNNGGRKWHVNGISGCDVLLEAVKKALADAGIANATVTLDRFEHKA